MTITTFTKTKNEDRKKEIFVNEEIFLHYCKYITLLWSAFVFVLNQFFYSFIKEVTLNYWCDLPSESKQGSKKTSQLPFLDKFT